MGATVAAYGMASGQPSTLSFVDFARAPLSRLVGFFLYAHRGGDLCEDLGLLAGQVSEGRLRVDTSISWDLSQTAEAVQVLRQRRSRARSSSPSDETHQANDPATLTAPPRGREALLRLATSVA